MNYIIETPEEFSKFISTIEHKKIVCVPIMSDINLHYVHDYLSLLYVRDVNSATGTIICFNHSESMSLSYEYIHDLFKSCSYAYVYDLKCILQYCNYKHVYDLELAYYFLKNESIDELEYNTNVHDYFYNKYYKLKNINYLIPIVKHYERCENFMNSMIPMISYFEDTDAFKWYNIMYRQLSKIENVGIYVDTEIFNQHFQTIPVNNLVYSEYNMYTTTGRPSNRHNGVNYAALNNNTGVRKSFISRYKNDGILMQLDYDSYHIRLLADLVGYKFDTDLNIHTYLGQQYFNKSELSDEEYKRSKQISFKGVYGTIDQNLMKIPFFKAVHEYTTILWTRMKLYGYIQTPIFKRTLKMDFYKDLNPQKLLNYMIQATETENNMYILNSFIQQKIPLVGRIVLYTYDSFLFDIHASDIKYIKQIKNIFEMNGKFPCSLQAGKNYDELVSITLR